MKATDLHLSCVIGHRGAAARAPENTLAGFRLAKSLGCDWIEFDVRLTGDDALVVCHDDRLQRTTDGRGAISALPLAAIRERDAGRWFGPRFAGERVPTLTETLALCRELELGANVEIKAERGRDRATARAVAGCLGDLPGSLPPILISSFLPDAVAEAAAQLPEIPRGMLWRKLPANWRSVATQIGCATIHLGQTDLTQAVAGQVIDGGYSLLAYTVNDPARARQLFGWGVASIFSDTPDIMFDAAREIGDGAQRGAMN